MEELRFAYTADDLLGAMRLHVLRSGRAYVVYAYILFMLAVGAVLLFFGFVDSGLFIMLVALIALPVVYLVALPLLARRQWRKIPAFQEEVLLRFDENELYMASEAGEGTSRWFYKTRANDTVLLLFINHLSYIIVPRRVCADDAQYARLKRLGEKLAKGNSGGRE